MLIFTTTACSGDPILEQAARNEAHGEAHGDPAAPAAPPPGDPGKPPPGDPGEPPPGEPGEPTPGNPGEPPPGDPGEPPPGDPGEPPPGAPIGEGPQVVITGSVAVDDWRPGGSIRIDAFDGDQRDLSAPRPSVVGMHRLSEPGAFSVSVPASAGAVWLGAYADLDGDDRPSPSEPSGWYSGNPVSLSGAVDGVSLHLTVEAPPPSAPE